MLSAFANAFRTPDLRRKILFTLFILAVFVVAGALIGAAMAPNTWAGIIGAGMGLIIGISVLYGIAED